MRVVIRGGVYARSATLTLGKNDSGAPGAPIVYRGCPGEEARILGGRVVTEWKPVSDRAVLARLTPEARGKVVQADLKALGVTDYGQVKSGGLELLFQDKPMDIDVDVHGCDRVRLVVTDGGDNIHSDHAAWGNARFTARGKPRIGAIGDVP